MRSRKVGLARALSKLGYCSRSQAAKLIGEGRVRLNESVRSDPETPVRLPGDRIEVDFRLVKSELKVYLMLNKPRGLVTTASDENDRETVYSCLDKDLPWVSPVGRLDKASEGLLLFTNDSEWAAQISDPQSHLDKTYHVQVGALMGSDAEVTLTNGVCVDDGELLRAKRARTLRSGQKNSWLELVLDEGKNRQIRRMFESLGIPVLRLIRVQVGPLKLGQLLKGKCRQLRRDEKAAMDLALTTSRERRSRRGQKVKMRIFRGTSGGIDK